jgi:polyketide cyclase/dehydrase/lipid transport protein
MLAMKYAIALLAILAVPLIVIGGAIVIGLDRASERHVFNVAFVAFAAGTLTTTLSAASRKPDLSKGIDEQAITLYGVLVGASAAFGLGMLTFALASGWPVIGLSVAAVGAAWFALWLPPRFRLMTAEQCIVINRDVPEVFELLSDARTMVRWDSRCEAVEMLTPEPIGPGTRFRERGRLPGGNPFSGVDQIVDFEPNRRYSSMSSSGLKNLEVVTFEAVGGGTRVSRRLVVEFQLWMALLGVALVKAPMVREILTGQQAAWARAKQLLESSTEPTS